MANDNAAPVGSGPPPDFSHLEGDIAQVESQYEPKIHAEEEEAQRMEQAAVSASEEYSKRTEESATTELSEEDRQMQIWLDHTPSRQAYYSTAMHAAPVLSILAALGGKISGMHGRTMLAAQTGIIQGLNESSEQKFNDAMQQWRTSYAAMRDHMRQLQNFHKLMLESYAGRADAYQKAADAARRMTGDLLRDEQKKTDQTIRSFQAQSAAWKAIQQVNTANESLAIRARREIAEEGKWKEATARAAQFPPEARELLKQEDARWRNDKTQRDEIAKQQGRLLSLGDTTDPETKRTIQERLNQDDEALARDMDAAIASRAEILSRYHGSSPLNPGSVTPANVPPRPGEGRRGVIARPGQPNELPPEAPAQGNREAVSAPPGLPPQNEKGWPLMHDPGAQQGHQWAYVGPNGEVQEVQAPTVQ